MNIQLNRRTFIKNSAISATAIGLASLPRAMWAQSIANYTLNISEKKYPKYRQILINNQIVGETLRVKMGEQLSIRIQNKLAESTLIHWHGMLLPNPQDGTHVTTQDITGGSEFTYQFPIRQTGTYWYHSHFGLQDQEGLYGAIVIEDDLNKQYPYQGDHVVLLSDQVLDSLENVEAVLKSGEIYSPASRGKQLAAGVTTTGMGQNNNMKTMHDSMMQNDNMVKTHDQMVMQQSSNMNNMPNHNQHDGGHMMGGDRPRNDNMPTKMPGHDMHGNGSTAGGTMAGGGMMHGADVIYDHILINGDANAVTLSGRGNSWQRLRFINAGASSYFRLQASSPFIVIATDGLPIQAVSTTNLLISNGETYDILLAVPKTGQVLIDVSAEAQNLKSQLIVKADGGADEKLANIPVIQTFEVLEDVRVLEQGPLSFPIKRAPDNAERIEINMALTGTMQNFSWSFDDIPYGKAQPIELQRNQRVRINLLNRTMMPHPMHLHGHFFRVLRSDGNLGIYKHTLNIPVMGAASIEFDTVEDAGKWLFHCHNLYHMKHGMMREIVYR